VKHCNVARYADDCASEMRAALAYIEAHLSGTLSPEFVAERQCVSVSQLYRDFYACTGHSVKEYIRKRRISNACEKIKCSELGLAVIAAESGYQTLPAFYKQFKSLVGMTPLAYRSADSWFSFYPFAVGEVSLAVKVGLEVLPAWATTRFYDDELRGIEDKAIASLGDVAGRVFGRNGKALGGRHCYELMVAEGEPTEDGGATYATCVVDYDVGDINAAWNYLYNGWLAASMFEESGGAYFEEFLFERGVVRRLKLYLPVKKQKAAHHIVIADVPEMTFVVARADGDNAERVASERVMAFLRARAPEVVESARRFYVCTEGGAYVCGVEYGPDFVLPDGGGVEILHCPAGRYAVLPDDRLGDMRIGGAKMALWLKNNGIAHEREAVFAVYQTLPGQPDDITMQLYQKLRDDKNG